MNSCSTVDLVEPPVELVAVRMDVAPPSLLEITAVEVDVTGREEFSSNT